MTNNMFTIGLFILLFVSFIVFRVIVHLKIKPAELGIAVGILLLGFFGIPLLTEFSETHDTEIWNSEVKAKKREKVSCSHSYPCNCRTDSKGNTTCDTCYEHSYDIDWVLYSGVGQRIRINRIDRQGLGQPQRWTIAKIGDPVAEVRSYKNYVKAVKYSAFNEERGDPKYDSYVPSYPENIYDYHYLNRVLVVGKIKIPDLKNWNLDLSNILKILGPEKQANVILIFTDLPKDFYYSILKVWNHGKKNDIIVIIGLKSSEEIDWVRVSSWSKKDIFNVKLRDSLTEANSLEEEEVLETISKAVLEDFQRRPMKEFEYLKSEITMPLWLVIISYIFLVGGYVGGTIFLNKDE